jgi:hypothetical protein
MKKYNSNDKFKCLICNKQFINGHKRNQHLKEVHFMTYEEYILKIYFNNEYPNCKCGCGTKMGFHPSNYGKWFQDYTTNHFPRKKHSKEIREKIKKRTKEALKEKYGVENIYHLKILKDKANQKCKQTKKERYGDENYNNPEKNKQTKKKKYGYEYYSGNKKTKKSEIEKFVQSQLQYSSGSFIYKGREFDIKVNDNIYEIDGDFYHPPNLKNLTLIQINSLINDYKKIQLLKYSKYKLYKIHVSELPEIITEENLKESSYIPDYNIEYKQTIISKEYFERYIENKGKEKLEKYIPLLLKFLRTFQTSFPFPEQEENLSEIINKIQKYDLNRIYDSGIFRNNISVIGNNYLKSNFKSYWNSAYGENLTPVQAYFDDDVMEKIIQYRIGCNDSNEIFNFSLHQIIRGLSARRLTVSFFKPLLATAIYHHFLKEKESPKVLDPCSGFGGRLLGFISKYPKGIYIGIEPNIDTFNELQNLRKNLIRELNLSSNQIQLHNIKFEDYKNYNENYDLVFTSIPYFNLEVYSNSVDYKSFKDWKNLFINHFYQFNNVYLNMNVELSEKLNLNEDYKILNNTSHFNKSSNKKYEVICKLK